MVLFLLKNAHAGGCQTCASYISALSKRMVTGPSLMKSTFISAPKLPISVSFQSKAIAFNRLRQAEGLPLLTQFHAAWQK